MHEKKTLINRIFPIIGILFILGAFSGCVPVYSDKGDKDTEYSVSTTMETELAESSVFQESEETTTKVTEREPVSETSESIITQKPEEETSAPEDEIKKLLDTMTLDEKIGRMVMVGLEGYTPDEKTMEMIEKYHVGGFILFSRNIEGPDQLTALLNSLKAANSRSKIPLLLSVDQEGGRVSRMPKELERFPDNQTVGKVNLEEFSYKLGALLAECVKAFGFNMNFAPVLDIHSNPNNPVIGDRSFGEDAEIVSRLGISVMKGMQDQGVISVVKHFPGHGDTDEDSHISLPSVEHSKERLMNFELVPFQNAIQNGADAVMIAHITVKEIDPDRPATLSEAVVTDLLREELNFDGVVVTDDLTMGAVMKNYDIGEAAVQSVLAGTDVLLVCHGYDNQVSVMEALKEAAENGTITEERIDRSVYRILKLMEKYRIEDRLAPLVNIDEINKKISDLLSTYIP